MASQIRGWLFVVLLGLAVVAVAYAMLGPSGGSNLGRKELAGSGKVAGGDGAPAGGGQTRCRINAVKLIGAWVNAGAPNGSFEFKDNDGVACVGSFNEDILPAFTSPNYWAPKTQACTSCHSAKSENSAHEMGLGTYEDIMAGGDCITKTCVKIIEPGNWDKSVLKERLRNNRMPPGMPFDITEANRDGPVVHAGGIDIHAVDLIGAWVNAGAPNGEFEFSGPDGSKHKGSFAKDILPAFTSPNYWAPNTQACTSCHSAKSENSAHEMGLGTYEDIMAGGDCITKTCVKIIEPGNWNNSVLRKRLRNNRMPPGVPFDITEANRDGPVVEAGHRR